MEDSVTLEWCVRAFENAEQASQDYRDEAERWRDYRNGDQWTQEEVNKLNKRKQPVVTIDRIGPKIDYLLGMEAQNRSDPKAYPRTPKHEDEANAATDALRYVTQQQHWDQTRSHAFDNFAVEGVCGADVRVVEKNGEKCIEILPMYWDRMFWDPHSRARDFSDAKYKGQFIWMDLEDATEQWPDKAPELEGTIAQEASLGLTYDDLPRTRWSDPKRRRVRIAEMYASIGGKVYYCKFTKAGLLEQIESPYKDEHGDPFDGFVFGSCFIDRDGDRFGVVKRWMSLQDEINKRRSKLLHLVSVRQTFGNQAVGDKNTVRNELAKPDGHVELMGGAKFGEDFGVIPTQDMATSQYQLLVESKAEIDNVGVNAAQSGTESRNMSGRALLARAEQGTNELGPIFDWFKSWQLQVYRTAWNMVRQFWTAEKWIRVTDNEKNVRFVGLNQPMTLGDQILQNMRDQGVKVTKQMEAEAAQSPALQAVVGVKNAVAEMDVDISIDAAPSSPTIQAEEFAALADLASKGFPIPPDALIEASSLRGKQKILESMRGGADMQDVPPQVMQAMQQLQAQNQELQQQLQEAQSGIAAKHVEVQGKLQQTAMQVEGQKEIAAMNAAQRQQQAELTAVIQSIAKAVDAKLSGSYAPPEEPAKEEAPDPMLLTLAALQQTLAQMAAPKLKETKIVAPSGEVYDARTVERPA